MDCLTIKNLIEKYVKHQLPESTINEIEEHLCTCEKCRTYLSKILENNSLPKKDIPVALSEGEKTETSVPPPSTCSVSSEEKSVEPSVSPLVRPVPSEEKKGAPSITPPVSMVLSEEGEVRSLLPLYITIGLAFIVAVFVLFLFFKTRSLIS